MVLIYTLFIVYILAINFYSFLLIKSQRDEYAETNNYRKSGDGKLVLAAFLGGAITIYVTMFIFRYRTKSLFLMLIMPIIAVLNVYLAIAAFRYGATFISF